jgi:Fe-S-cluster containining protein
MQVLNLLSFKKKIRKNRPAFRKFLNRLRNNPPRGLDSLAVRTNKLVWQETDCLACANCCKTMSPTYTNSDVLRISQHLGMTPEGFRKKWLVKDRHGDYLNKQMPCQFLDLKTNMCGIYAVRPKDCAGFPHHTKRQMVDYMHVFKQNIDFCPATYKLVERMMEQVKL